MIRSLQPTDIPAVILMLARSPLNEARTRESIDPGTTSLMSTIPLLRGHFLERDKHHTTVSVRHGCIDGLISMRNLSGPGAWEINRILLGRGQEHICSDLLEQLAYLRENVGAEKILLRLNADSPVVASARQAGFCPYLTEFLYHRDQKSTQQVSLGPAFRSRLDSDGPGLFRLYSATVPLVVRNALGLTAQEWHDSEDRSARRELVLEEEGTISAHVRIRTSGKAKQVDIISIEGGTKLDALVDDSLVSAGGRSVFWLVAEHQARLCGILEDRGFRRIQVFSCLARQLTARICEPQLAMASMGMSG